MVELHNDLGVLFRVSLAAGRREDGLAAFAQVRKLAPSGTLEQDLRREFPEFGSL